MKMFRERDTPLHELAPSKIHLLNRLLRPERVLRVIIYGDLEGRPLRERSSIFRHCELIHPPHVAMENRLVLLLLVLFQLVEQLVKGCLEPLLILRLRLEEDIRYHARCPVVHLLDEGLCCLVEVLVLLLLLAPLCSAVLGHYVKQNRVDDSFRTFQEEVEENVPVAKL